MRAGDLAAAERLSRRVLARVPADSEALNILGAVAFGRRDFAEAERLFERAVASDARNLAARFNLGKVYEVQRRFDEAAGAYAFVLREAPENAETRLRLAIVRYEQSRLGEAALLFEEVLRADPGHRVAALSLGVTYNGLGRYEESVAVLRALLDAEPELIDAYHALADSLYELHRADDAAHAAHAALARDGGDVQALVLLGQAESERGAYVKAERLFRQATAFAPNRHEPLMNLGVLLQRLGRIDEALDAGAKAVALAPEDALAHFNFGTSLLLAGDYRRGWPELEWRMLDRRLSAHFPYRDRIALWDGSELEGRELLIAREQGIGDFVLFSRLLAEVKERRARVVVEVPHELAALYRDFDGIDELVIERCEPGRIEGFAAHLPLCSLPFVLGVEETSIPRGVPYIRAPAERVARFEERFSALRGRKIGVVWAGSSGHLLDRYRSAGLAEFGALAGIPGVAWVSLQKGAALADLPHAPDGFAPLDVSADLRTFADTAGAIAALDLVIAVDTAVAHLAGALGTPVWLLHGFGNYWLWRLDRSDSPWYPTMRIFRQRQPNVWANVFADVRAALLDELER